MGLMTALLNVTHSTGLRTGEGGRHTKTHTTLWTTRRRIRNVMWNNKLTVNTGQGADITVRGSCC